MKRFLAILLVATLLIAVVPTTSLAASQYATVVGGWLRLRADTNYNSKTLNSYATGTQVEILRTSGSWYYVKAPDGKQGYMLGSYLKIGGSAANPDTDIPIGSGSATVASSNGLGVRLRTGPGTGYSIVRSYPVGSKAIVLSHGSYWSRINIGGTVGYMMNQFLNFNGGTDVDIPGKGNATIWSKNGYGVRLRTGAGSGYGVIGVYSVGTQVMVLEHGATWCKIQVGSRVGYMMTSFLNIRQSNEVTAVKLNKKQPLSGDILTVTTTPSNAQVDYAWLVDGAVVGTDKDFWLTKGTYEDKSVTVRVTGTNGFTGGATASTDPVLSAKIDLTSLELNNNTPAIGDTMSITKVEPEGATYSCKWTYVNSTGNTITLSDKKTFTATTAHAEQKITITITGTGIYTGTEETTVTIPAKGDIASLDSLTVENLTAPGASPNAGHELEAVVTPATSQVSYAWYKVITKDDGTFSYIKLGSSSKLMITAAYADCEIIVRVKGKGPYTTANPFDLEASVDSISKLKRIKSINLSPMKDITFVVNKDDISIGKGTKLTASVTASVAVSAANLATTYKYSWLVHGVEVGNEPTYTVSESDVGYPVTVTVTALDTAEWTDEEFTATSTDVVKASLVVAKIKTETASPAMGETVTVETYPAGAVDHAIITWYIVSGGKETRCGTGISYTLKEADVKVAGKLKAVVLAQSPYYGSASPTVTLGISNLSAELLPGELDTAGQEVVTPETDPNIEPIVPETDPNIEPIVPETDPNIEPIVPETDPTNTAIEPIVPDQVEPIEISPGTAEQPLDALEDVNLPEVSLKLSEGTIKAKIDPAFVDLDTVITYCWYRANVILDDETQSSYKLKDEDWGQLFKVTITYMYKDIPMTIEKSMTPKLEDQTTVATQNTGNAVNEQGLYINFNSIDYAENNGYQP